MTPEQQVRKLQSAEARAERLAFVIVDLALQAYGDTEMAVVAALQTVDMLTEQAYFREGDYHAEVAAEAADEFGLGD